MVAKGYGVVGAVVEVEGRGGSIGSVLERRE